MIVGLLRHGRTAWNDTGRMQGRADIPLSAQGRAQVRGWRIPASLEHARLVTSPLSRASETARLLGGRKCQPSAEVVAALIEMDWGAWEGETLAALRSRHGAAFAAASARGLHFRPPGGESPHDVQQRVVAWLVATARDAPGSPLIAVTHQGVIRALLAGIAGWTMTGKPPVRLADDVVHVIAVDPGGAVRAIEWNVPLVDGAVGRRRSVDGP